MQLVEKKSAVKFTSNVEFGLVPYAPLFHKNYFDILLSQDQTFHH